MNKTTYIKPEMAIEEIELESMIALSVGDDVEEMTIDAQGRRGSWGDLWGSEE